MTPPIDENTIALFQSIAKKDAKKVLEALKNGADANARDGRGTSALKYAMTFGDVETAKILIEHGAKVKNQDILPELAAYGRGGAAMAKQLLKAGADVDEKTGGGYTPLIIAAGRGYKDIVKVLLEAGADVHAMGESKRTAKSLAYERGYLETAHLIEKWELKKSENPPTHVNRPKTSSAKKMVEVLVEAPVRWNRVRTLLIAMQAIMLVKKD